MSLSNSSVPTSSVAPRSKVPRFGFRHIVRGAIWNWTDFAVNAVVTFFLSPFVVHHLGSVAYGVWILVNSIVSYMALVDMGMRGTVVRFVSSDQPRGQHAEASRAVSAAIWFRLWIGLLILGISLVVCLRAPHMFHIPAEMQPAARWVILLAGGNLAISLTFGIFGGVLNALHRFDRLSAVGMFRTLVNAGGVVFLLQRGHGIVAMAAWQFLAAVTTGALLCALAFRTYPELKLLWGVPDRDLVRKFFGYSTLLFIIAIGGQVIYYTDNIVIGAVLPISSVTLYAIGFAPTQYLQQIVGSLGVTFMPAASSLGARQEWDQLRQLLFRGTRTVLLVALPIEVALYFRGRTFVGLWMGHQYAGPSGGVLKILILSWFFISINSCSGNIVYGLSKHRPVAIWTACEAVANLSLSIILVHRMGIEGVAWGSVIPSLFIHALVWPRYITKVLRVPLLQYLLQAWLRPGLCVVPFAVACFLCEKFWPAARIWSFLWQMAAILPVFLLSAAIAFRKGLAFYIRKTMPRPVPVAAGDPA